MYGGIRVAPLVNMDSGVVRQWINHMLHIHFLQQSQPVWLVGNVVWHYD